MSSHARPWLLWLVLAAGMLACSSRQDDTLVHRGGGASSDPNAKTDPIPGSETNDPLASVTLTPSEPTVVVAGFFKQFSVAGKDASGKVPIPYPTFTWSVSGGGSIGSNGLFSALVPGGPYTVTVTGGGKSASTSVTVTPAPIPTITIGETSILAGDDSGEADILLAQETKLAQPATLRSLSFYVAVADGNLRLGLYDATGPGGGPGAKKAETPEFAAVQGWNAVNVQTPVLLAAGTYWLAFTPSSNDLQSERADDCTGSTVSIAMPFGPLPNTFSTTPAASNNPWSFYGTLNP